MTMLFKVKTYSLTLAFFALAANIGFFATLTTYYSVINVDLYQILNARKNISKKNLSKKGYLEEVNKKLNLKDTFFSD